MSAVSAVTSAMALRPNTAFQRFTSYTVHRDDEEAYFGTDGDVSLSFNATRNCLVADGQGTAVEVRGLNMAPDRLMLEKVFGGKLVTINASVLFSTDNDFEVLGTNADATEITNDPEGGLILTTEGAANDQTILVPITTAGRSPWSSNTWGTDKQTRFEAVIRTGASVATEKIWVGLKLTNTNVLTTDADQAFFLYDTAGAAVAAKWHAIYSIANVDTDVSTTLADVAASTTYHFLIDIDSARLARFYINGTLVATSTALTTAVDLIPYIGIMDTAGAAKTITAVKASISRQQG